MITLDVPFVPHGDYPEFLHSHQEHLASVHFSLYDPALSDARQRLEEQKLDAILEGLAPLTGIPKYVLLNTRIHSPEKYFSNEALAATADRLALLKESADINGLIFSDPYYLQALSDSHPEIACQLEAVPSVNAMLDSAQRAFAMLDMIGRTRFRPPGKLVLDRSLNRDLSRLEDVSQRLKAREPDIRLDLIANEGCLLNCPYKPAHDAHIAMVNEGLCGDRTFAMNRDFGCIRHIMQDPSTILESPFIRPEDMDQYAPLVHGIKLCGRNKGTHFLKQTITAYIQREYDGNLLDLMDAMGDLSDRLTVPNGTLPPDFLAKVTDCGKSCRACGWCSELADKVITRTDPGLQRL